MYVCFYVCACMYVHVDVHKHIYTYIYISCRCDEITCECHILQFLKDENKQRHGKTDRSTWMTHYESVTNMVITVQ